jgi:hypothetical protein
MLRLQAGGVPAFSKPWSSHDGAGDRVHLQSAVDSLQVAKWRLSPVEFHDPFVPNIQSK